MFGRLTVSLPIDSKTSAKGGELQITRDDIVEKFDKVTSAFLVLLILCCVLQPIAQPKAKGGSSKQPSTWVFSESKYGHEITPVLSGYRVDLQYNVYKAKKQSEKNKTIAKAKWELADPEHETKSKAEGKEDKAPFNTQLISIFATNCARQLTLYAELSKIWLLEHQYDKGVNINRLHGTDAQLVRILRAIFGDEIIKNKATDDPPGADRKLVLVIVRVYAQEGLKPKATTPSRLDGEFHDHFRDCEWYVLCSMGEFFFVTVFHIEQDEHQRLRLDWQTKFLVL